MQKYHDSVLNETGTPAAGVSVLVSLFNGGVATIYSDNGVTEASNPLTTNSLGYFEFYGADGRYTLTISGDGIETINITDVLLEDPQDGSAMVIDGGTISDSVISGGTVTDSALSNITIDSVAVAGSDIAKYSRLNDADGADLIGFSYAVSYAAGTIGAWLKDLATSAGATFIGFIQSGTGATLRTVQNKLRDTFGVKDFGAVIGDGVADDTAFFQAADTNGKPYIVPQGTYKCTAELWGAAYSFGPVTFVGGGGAAVVNLAKAVRVPLKGKLFAIDANSQMTAPEQNILTNASFHFWPTGMVSSLAANEDKYVCGNWRIVTHDTNTCTVSKINAINGGLALAIVYGATAAHTYVRQLAPVIDPMSGRTYTFSADVEVDNAVEAVLYINARITAVDADRVLVINSQNLALSVGRKRLVATFDVPDLSAVLGSVDIKNSLEFALTFYGQNKTVNVKIREMILSPGEEIKAGAQVYPARDVQDVELFYETGSIAYVGLNTTSGQKRITVPYHTRKYSAVTGSVSDLVGNAGKISTYDVAGVRTDNVTPTALTFTQSEVTVILNGSTAGGIGFNYIANCYP